jgi:nucleolar protein 53
MSEAAPAQYKQKSRKGKKAWRKNVDVTEVAAGLDEVRDQIITGYALPYLHNTVLLVF